MLPPPTDALETVTLQTLQKTFAINTYGPLLLTQALLPNVLASVGGDMAPIIAVTSSRVGSLADNSSGGLYAYRSSKTAVNSIFKNLSVELKDKGVVVSMLREFSSAFFLLSLSLQLLPILLRPYYHSPTPAPSTNVAAF